MSPDSDSSDSFTDSNHKQKRKSYMGRRDSYGNERDHRSVDKRQYRQREKHEK